MFKLFSVAQQIMVPVWYDGNNQFLNGALIAVNSDASVVGIVQKPTGHFVPGYPKTKMDTLYIRDTILGGLYLNMTRAQFNTLAGLTASSPNQEKNLTVTISGTPTTVTSASLYNATVNKVSKNGTGVDIRTITYSSNPIALTGTITFGSALANADVIEILYFTN